MRKDLIQDNFHGTVVVDPYRYLEDPQDCDTQAFVARHNERARTYLSSLPLRDAWQQRLGELWDRPRYNVPYRGGTRYFFQKNDGLANQAVLYVQEGIDGAPRVLLDPNKLSDDGTVALMSFSPSPNGQLLAISCSVSGSDWQEVRVLDVDSGALLSDLISHVKFTNIAWVPDGSGFYYSRFPDPRTVAPGEESYNNTVYFHYLGAPQDQDAVVFSRPDFRELGFSPAVSEDGKFLFLTVWHGTDPENRFYYLELTPGAQVTRLHDSADAAYHLVGSEGDILYFLTTLDAPRGKIIAVDIKRPRREHWVTIVPQGDETIDHARLIGGEFMVIYLAHAHHNVRMFDRKGDLVHTLNLPALGSINAITGKGSHTAAFFGFASFLFSTTIYRYEITTRDLSPFWPSVTSFDPSDFVTKQEFYTSRDGTSIPLFVVHRRDLALTGTNPTLLYAYGGFNISMTPGFSETVVAWLASGGVYAQACLRGGGEYGEEWHRAGMLEKKQNVFDDFHAAAEYLVRQGYTEPQRLGIMGGSNGGLLVAACMTQRPELYGAVVCRVPVIDMLRYHKFTVGRYWIGEYGNADQDAEHFKFLLAYSPLHNVRANVDYPPTLIMTADTDDRVVPAHAYKFMATLEEFYSGSSPIIMRVETKAGHGAGKPTGKIIAESADMLAFLHGVL